MRLAEPSEAAKLLVDTLKEKMDPRIREDDGIYRVVELRRRRVWRAAKTQPRANA
jgi:hypothetical protein